MKALRIFYALLVLFMFGSANAQDKTEKVQTPIETLLKSKSFEFIANTAIPLSGPTKDLVGSGYSITFSPEEVISNMPFYGRGYSGMALGRDKGMQFQGKPENFTIESNNEYQVNTDVKGERDTYSISISVSSSGYASLTISSNDRGTITYQGEIVKIQR
ncbi:DUF4251 domain-containing protein [Aequorivita sp. CIP111184]|uniref:DUF4251 domain-containing protein n=1 Tax=Aequorivita sp. CIP111184 TaxID=2211356 RepID=UPI000DBBD6C9|nr:DUF4251 domain-containing protein [Aequorivita sp. CIP111184]SRX54721.1 hypothetical protein AEQU1_01733 [Aequorivita sp. CIP111184]